MVYYISIEKIKKIVNFELDYILTKIIYCFKFSYCFKFVLGKMNIFCTGKGCIRGDTAFLVFVIFKYRLFYCKMYLVNKKII